MATSRNSLVAQTFYLIRSRDVELAEDFLHRCPPEIRTIRELNAFFHRLLAQYHMDTFTIRLSLEDNNDYKDWATTFVAQVLPFFILNRFPSNTCLRVSSYYTDLTSMATSFAAAR